MERHKGNIGMVAVEGKGTVVYIEIPVAGFISSTSSSDKDESPLATSSIEPCRIDSSAVFKEMSSVHYDFELADVKLNSAMIASHQPALVSVISDMVRTHVANIVVAATDAQAVATMREAVDNFERFNIVYIDRDLPGRHSYVVLSRLRKFGYTGVAVLLSGESFMDTNSRFLSCGGDAVLFQPVNGKDIEMTLLGEYSILL